jgi:pimeloyl-ACP methyl ester carboxylesterase
LRKEIIPMINTIYIGETPVRYEDAGEGDVLVFLHGHLESMEIWGDFTRFFEKNYRVIRFDLPGHGGSGLFGSASGMEVMALAVKRVLENLNVGKAVFFGHSMGGYSALAALEFYPDVFSGIVLFHSHPLPDSLEVAKKRDREIQIINKGQKGLLVNLNIPNMYALDNTEKFQDEVQRSITIAHGLSDEGVIAAIRGLKARPDRSDVLKNAGVPCLNIIGKKDNYIDFEDVSMRTELPEGSMRWVLENSGHMGFIEEPEKAQEGIIQFLNSIG